MMDTTRRQLLAGIPAVGIASVVGQGQDAPAPEMAGWEYNIVETDPGWLTVKGSRAVSEYDESDWSYFLKQKRGEGFNKVLGEHGWSIVFISPPALSANSRDSGTGAPSEMVLILLKRPRDERKRVVWEFKMFRPVGIPIVQFQALGKQGWEICHTSFLDIRTPDLIFAQRVVKGVEVDNR